MRPKLKLPFVSRRRYEALSKLYDEKLQALQRKDDLIANKTVIITRQNKELHMLHQEVHARKLNTACADKALSLVTEISLLEPTYDVQGRVKNLPRIRKAIWTKILAFRKDCQKT